MHQDQILISIVIPVKNGEPWLHDCLGAIMNQTLFHRSEIIILDSGSSDQTSNILSQYPVKVYPISPGEFNHGLTRNFGVQQCRGEYVVMTVQDARPTDNLWLQKMLDGFSASENVAAVCGQQVVPHDNDKNPVDWFRPQSEPQVRVCKFDSADSFDQLTPAEKKAACSWDDVTAMYRRDTITKIPFREVSYGEDALWAAEALKAGYTLVYNPTATVYHYHNEDWNFTFKRTLTVMYLWYKNFGFVYPTHKQSTLSLLRMIKVVGKSKSISFKEKWKWILYNQQRHKATRAAQETFLEALGKGEKKLDEIHAHHCGIPPSPLKPVKSTKSIQPAEITI